MEQLNNVYNAFTKLEQNYKRSKKSRREYLTDKFGGDIEVGSMVIIDYFSGVNLESAEDIEKLSTIRDIFSAIKKNIDSLDTLDSFDELLVDGASNAASVALLLETAAVSGSNIGVMPTEAMAPHVHYKATANNVMFVPLISAKKIRVFNKSMSSFVQSLVGSQQVTVGQTYMQGPGGLLSLVKL